MGAAAPWTRLYPSQGAPTCSPCLVAVSSSRVHSAPLCRPDSTPLEGEGFFWCFFNLIPKLIAPHTQDTFNEQLLTHIPKTSQGRCHAIHLFLCLFVHRSCQVTFINTGLIDAGRSEGRQSGATTESAFWVFKIYLGKEPVHLNKWRHSGQGTYKGLSRSLDVFPPKVTTPIPPCHFCLSPTVSLLLKAFPGRTPSCSAALTQGLVCSPQAQLCSAWLPTTL